MSLYDTLRDYYDEVFWILFAAIAILTVASMFSTGFIEIGLGLLLIMLGIHRLDGELRHKKHENRNSKLETYTRDIGKWLNGSHTSNSKTKDSHEKRIHVLDRKRVSHEKKTEKQYRDLVRKVTGKEELFT